MTRQSTKAIPGQQPVLARPILPIVAGLAVAALSTLATVEATVRAIVT